MISIDRPRKRKAAISFVAILQKEVRYFQMHFWQHGICLKNEFSACDSKNSLVWIILVHSSRISLTKQTRSADQVSLRDSRIEQCFKHLYSIWAWYVPVRYNYITKYQKRKDLLSFAESVCWWSWHRIVSALWDLHVSSVYFERLQYMKLLSGIERRNLPIRLNSWSKNQVI